MFHSGTEEPGIGRKGEVVSAGEETDSGGSCWYCGSDIHQDIPCPKRVADADRAVAGFVDRKSVNLDPDYRTIDMVLQKDLTDPIKRLCSRAELTGVEASAAIAMEFRLNGTKIPDRVDIIKRVRAAMAARQAMGRKHYGMTLQDNPAKIKERVRHLWEETLDGLAYSQWIWEGWMCPPDNDPDFHESVPAGRVAMECIKLFTQALVELDRLMYDLGMDPVRKEGEP
jgi:hypothetical protein